MIIYLCANTKHHDDIQYFHDNIISASIQAATNIPKTSQSSNIPGWNMHVEDQRKLNYSDMICSALMGHKVRAQSLILCGARELNIIMLSVM